MKNKDGDVIPFTTFLQLVVDCFAPIGDLEIGRTDWRKKHMLKMFKSFLTIVLSLCLLFPMNAQAAEVVTPEEMHQDLIQSWSEKEQNLETLQRLLSTDAARELIEKSGSSYGQVMQALPQLDEKELSKLASQTRIAQANFAAGISDREMINVLLIVLLVVAIIVIVASVAD